MIDRKKLLIPPSLADEPIETAAIPQQPTAKKWRFPWLWVLAITGVAGGVGAIALPSFLGEVNGCGNAGRQAEARQYVGAMNRGQQAYFIENNKFASNLDKLELGIKVETASYRYLTIKKQQSAFNFAVSRQGTDKTLSYVGAVFAIPDTSTEAVKDALSMTTTSIVCVAQKPGKEIPAMPIFRDGKLICGAGTSLVSFR